MLQTLTIKDINFARYTNASKQSFHMEIVKILQLSGLFDNRETRALFDLYNQKNVELEQVGKYKPSLLTTPDVKAACQESDLAFRHLLRELRALKYHTSSEVLAAFPQLEMSILNKFPSSTAKCGMDVRNQYYNVMASRLVKDWSELIGKVGLMPEVERLLRAAEAYNEVSTERIKEKSDKDPGKAHRLLAELRELYRRLMWYLNAWGNNPTPESPYCERAEKARATIQTCNELIGQFHKSMLISAANRRRSQK